jgi:phosphoesterase RecJ-like protein
MNVVAVQDVVPAVKMPVDADTIIINIIKMLKSSTPIQILEVLNSASKPILCIDGRMDMDAYCSALAISYLLKKRVTLFSSHPTLTGYYLKIIKALNIDISDIKMGVDPINIDFSKYDLQIFIDSGNIEHISQHPDFKPDNNIKKVNIDHHFSNNSYGDYNYIKEYSSACSVLYEILNDQNINIDEHLAKLLLIGILCDSNFLRNSNVQPHEYADVANLIKISQFQPYKLNEVISISSIEDTKIRKIAFKNLVINKDAKYAYSFSTISDYQAERLDIYFKGLPAVDVIKNIEGLDFVFFIRQDVEKFNVSFRSVNFNFNVLNFAEKLNGGGHKVAAAGTIQTQSIDEAISKVIEVISSTNNI